MHSEEVMSLIRIRAYELYQRDGCRDGHDREHWLKAEQEVLGMKDPRGHLGVDPETRIDLEYRSHAAPLDLAAE